MHAKVCMREKTSSQKLALSSGESSGEKKKGKKKKGGWDGIQKQVWKILGIRISELEVYKIIILFITIVYIRNFS